MNANRISRLRNMIGSSFMDTILIAKEKDALLCSDDFILRILAETEFGVGGIWTQVFLIFALNNSSLNSADYKNATIRLAILNYRYTTINSDILLEAAKIAKWKWSEPYLSIVKILNGGISSDRSSILVARDFILKLFSLNIYVGNRNQLMLKLMDSITRNRDRKLVIEILLNQFENSSLPVLLINEIKEHINFWFFYSI